MPGFRQWVSVDSDSTTAPTSWSDTSYIYRQYCDEIYEAQHKREQQMREEHQQMVDEQEQQAKELREDKKKYPLFFLKEGIV